MDVKKLQKKYGITLDEEKDAFLSSLNKRYRNNRKKLNAIEDLEKLDKATLKAEQLEKIKSKAEITENVKYLDGIRDMYYAALKTAQDEGKLPKTTEAAAPTKTEEQPSEAKAPEVKPEPVQQKQVPTQSAEERQAELARISRDNVSKIVNLVHFAQFFRDHHRVQEFRQVFEANRGDFQLEAAPEFEIVSEFYTKVFNFTESDKLGKVGDKTNRSVGELEHYVNGVDQPALRNKTYRHLQHVVEGVVASAFFRDHTADIEVHHHKQHHHHPHHHEHGAIGSTRKHETEKVEAQTEEAPVQEKHKSPEKAHHHAHAEPAKPQEHKHDWTAVEDEEEEAGEGEFEGEEGEEQAGEAEEEKQEKKEDDGWATVASKKKEKKEEPFRGSGAGFRGRGRGGRGGRGGFRGERKPRPEGEAGQEGERQEGGQRRGGYRGPRQDRRSPGEEGVEGENAGEGQREGGYRGGRGHRGGFRGHRGGQRGEGRGGYRGEGRGGYRGGQQRGPREEGNQRPAGEEVVNKQE